MPQNFTSVEHVHDFAGKCRGSAGIAGIPANLYRQYVIRQARGALQTTLCSEDSQFLQDVCKGVDGLGPDMDKGQRVYVGHETLYRLSTFPPAAADLPPVDDECGRPDDSPITDTIGTPVANREIQPAPKTKRKRKPKAE